MHIPILAEREDVDLAVLADLDVAKARTIADRMGVPEALNPDEVLRREDLDAIVLCTPNGVHEEMAVRALEAGKDVFVERPVAITPEGVERVLGVARERGRRLVVGQPHRFRADATALRSFVAGGEMGEIYAVRGSWRTRRIPILRPTWRQR
jgi:predicted dehydrogenase